MPCNAIESGISKSWSYTYSPSLEGLLNPHLDDFLHLLFFSKRVRTGKKEIGDTHEHTSITANICMHDWSGVGQSEHVTG